MYKYKVTGASRREEVLQRKTQYDEEYDRMNAEYNSDVNRYREAVESIIENIKQVVITMIGNTTLKLNVDAQLAGDYGFDIYIDNGDRPFDGQALSWRYRCYLAKDGSIRKETGSWSGLEVTTSKQIENLKESVRVLEILNNIDWKSILSTKQPNFKDYIKHPYPGQRQSFNKELLEATIQDAIEDGFAIKGYGYKYYRAGVPVIYRILNESDKQYTVQEIHESEIGNESRYYDPYRISKKKFINDVIKQPIETIKL